MRYFLIASCLILIMGSLNYANADKFILKSGAILEGEVIDQGEDYLKIKTRSGAVEIYSLDEVKYMKKEPVLEKEEKAQEAVAQPMAAPQPDNQYGRINEQIGGLFSSAANAQKGMQANVTETMPANGGPYDQTLNNLSGDMNGIIQMYQQAITQMQDPMMSGAGAASSADPTQAAAGILKQYQDAMNNLDKTTQAYQQKK